MEFEKNTVKVWDYTLDSFDEVIHQVNQMIADGWRLTCMKKARSGQELEIDFEREVPVPPASPIQLGFPTRESADEQAMSLEHILLAPTAPETKATVERIAREIEKENAQEFPKSPTPPNSGPSGVLEILQEPISLGATPEKLRLLRVRRLRERLSHPAKDEPERDEDHPISGFHR